MKQQSLGLGQSSKRTRRREFLGEMEQVVPWAALVALVSPYLPEGRRGRHARHSGGEQPCSGCGLTGIGRNYRLGRIAFIERTGMVLYTRSCSGIRLRHTRATLEARRCPLPGPRWRSRPYAVSSIETADAPTRVTQLPLDPRVQAVSVEMPPSHPGVKPLGLNLCPVHKAKLNFYLQNHEFF
jgi:hypothetical protein